MRTLAVAAIVFAGTIGIGVGAAQAGEKNAAAKVPTVEFNGLTYRVGIDIDGDWEPRLPSETGALPASGSGAVRGRASGSDEKVPTVEIGGRTYRVGLDTGP